MATDIVEEATVTLQEVAEELMEELTDPRANYCTFDYGYVRQSLFACRTCNEASGTHTFGFCAGCSVRCHNDHDIYELWEKRDFRCDCGTAAAPASCLCDFDPEATKKELRNTKNRYNHNFNGRYCWCDKEHDEENQQEDELQCIVCEDWFHLSCLQTPSPGVTVPMPGLQENAGFLICRDCIPKVDFLLHYPKAIVNTAPQTNTVTAAAVSAAATAALADAVPANATCKITGVPKLTLVPGQSLFLTESFRAELCSCAQCKADYVARGALCVVEEEIEIHDKIATEAEEAETAAAAAENRPNKRPAEQAGAILQQMEHNALSNLPRAQVLDVMQAMAMMKSELTSQLQAIGASGRAVSADDIRTIFAQLKRRREE
eukprot:TRINITY_DN7410_c0_g1_i1.p1 TRINITY_DN7410_c0_g1~~TRINITY_DN7410_c0_g1_i1.p1  ORF type:complete len:376 (-),score=102.49 TRINITY_DN7410_c0_g1_i1:80-1207(-)